jgi:hypothetical protein
LSNTDRRALKTIIRAPKAQCPQPLMMILWGTPGDWSFSAWQAVLQRKRPVGYRLAVSSLAMSYGAADSHNSI